MDRVIRCSFTLRFSSAEGRVSNKFIRKCFFRILLSMIVAHLDSKGKSVVFKPGHFHAPASSLDGVKTKLLVSAKAFSVHTEDSRPCSVLKLSSQTACSNTETFYRSA